MLWSLRFGGNAVVDPLLRVHFVLVPTDVDLATEKWGLLVMVAIGEMAIASASNAVMGDTTIDALKSVGIMVLVSSFAYLTKILYFDLFDSARKFTNTHFDTIRTLG